MPRVSVVAKNYAKALFVAARKANLLDKVSAELDVLKNNFSTSFASELKNPVISKLELDRVIDGVTKKFSLGPIVSNFFSSVVRNRRLNLVPEICEEFRRIYSIQQNILVAEVISSAMLGDDVMDSVKSFISKRYPQKNVSVKNIVKDSILGGLQIRIESEIMDASLANQLESLKKDLLSVIN